MTGKSTASAAGQRLEAARDCLIEAYQNFIRPIAAALRRKLPSSFSLDDLMSAGTLGLSRPATSSRRIADARSLCQEGHQGRDSRLGQGKEYRHSTMPPIADEEFPASGPTLKDQALEEERLRRLRGCPSLSES